MSRLIDTSYFVAERQLPADAAQDRLLLFIDKYQEELLMSVLGCRLYKAFMDALAAAAANVDPVPLDQKWIDLRDGGYYDDAAGRLRKWVGLITAATKRSMIANYVYYWWTRDSVSSTTLQGEKAARSEGSDNVSPAVKQCRAWNEMSMWIEELILFLQARSSDFPEFEEADLCVIRDTYRPINAFNL